jgi:hypothetical protein
MRVLSAKYHSGKQINSGQSKRMVCLYTPPAAQQQKKRRGKLNCPSYVQAFWGGASGGPISPPNRGDGRFCVPNLVLLTSSLTRLRNVPEPQGGKAWLVLA